MPVDSKHPLYVQFLPDWVVMSDTHAGERVIKDAGETYLPATSGQKADGMTTGQPGRAAYDAYVLRASFPDVVKSAVDAMLGVMHHKPPVIELPAGMEDMREAATLNGESLELLLRRINENQLLTGRLGLLLDVPTGAPVGAKPYIAIYQARSILNWDDGSRQTLVAQNLNLVSLDESEFDRVMGFEWEFKRKFRVLILGDSETNEPAGAGVYQVGTFNDSGSTFSEAALVTPSIGGRTLDKIPFVFINSKDIVPDPDAPPLLGLARLALTIYRGEADYRQSLFMQGQDTLVVIGAAEDEKYRVGANAAIGVPTGGDAKFIGADSTGIAEMRMALDGDKARASEKGGQLIDATSRTRESGEALKIRVAARTATLNQIVMAGAFGLQTSLRMAATWRGLDPEAVTVLPNLDFVDDDLDGRTLVEWLTAKQLGAPLSLRSIHDRMRERDLTSMEFEEELAELNKETDLAEGLNATNPDEE